MLMEKRLDVKSGHENDDIPTICVMKHYLVHRGGKHVKKDVPNIVTVGHWVTRDNPEYEYERGANSDDGRHRRYLESYECSLCHTKAPMLSCERVWDGITDHRYYKSDFCPRCGAYMEEPENEEQEQDGNHD